MHSSLFFAPRSVFKDTVSDFISPPTAQMWKRLSWVISQRFIWGRRGDPLVWHWSSTPWLKAWGYHRTAWRSFPSRIFSIALYNCCHWFLCGKKRLILQTPNIWDTWKALRTPPRANTLRRYFYHRSLIKWIQLSNGWTAVSAQQHIQFPWQLSCVHNKSCVCKCLQAGRPVSVIWKQSSSLSSQWWQRWMAFKGKQCGCWKIWYTT